MAAEEIMGQWEDPQAFQRFLHALTYVIDWDNLPEGSIADELRPLLAIKESTYWKDIEAYFELRRENKPILSRFYIELRQSTEATLAYPLRILASSEFQDPANQTPIDVLQPLLGPWADKRFESRSLDNLSG